MRSRKQHTYHEEVDVDGVGQLGMVSELVAVVIIPATSFWQIGSLGLLHNVWAR